MIPIFSGFSLVKLLEGFNIFNGEKLGKLIFYLVVGVLIFIGCMAFWVKLTGATQHIDKQTIEKYYACPEDKSLLRIKAWKIFNLGIGG